MYPYIHILIYSFALLCGLRTTLAWSDGHGKDIPDTQFSVWMGSQCGVGGYTWAEVKDLNHQDEAVQIRLTAGVWGTLYSFLPWTVDINTGHWSCGSSDGDYNQINYANQHLDVQTDSRCTAHSDSVTYYKRCLIDIHPL